MKYNRFEDLPVWRLAIDLALRVFSLTEDDAFRARGDVCDQMRRAALSISNNIAEGFERGTIAELLNFLYIARGSAGEVRSILLFCEEWPRTAALRADIEQLKAAAESCSRQIRGWAESLQNSDYKGQKNFTQRDREIREQKNKAEEFLNQLKEAQEQRIARLEEERRQKMDSR
mgnify:CR=1 FL=1